MPTYHITFLQTNTYTFANSAGPDETALYVLSYQNLNCLPLYYWSLTETPICNAGYVQPQIWKSPYQILNGEKVKDAIYAIMCAACVEYEKKVKLEENWKVEEQHKRNK